MGEIIWSKINLTNVGQNTEIQYLEDEKQPKFITNIVKNYFRVLEVLSSLNFELEFKSEIGSVQTVDIVNDLPKVKFE